MERKACGLNRKKEREKDEDIRSRFRRHQDQLPILSTTTKQLYINDNQINSLHLIITLYRIKSSLTEIGNKSPPLLITNTCRVIITLTPKLIY